MKKFWCIALLIGFPCYIYAQTDATSSADFYSNSNITSILKSDTQEFTKAYPDKFKLSLIIGAGLNINAMSTANTSPYYNAGGRSYTSTLPEVLFGANLFANPNTGKLVFRLELALGESQYRSSYQNKVEPYVGIRSDFDQLGMRVLPQILYNFYNGDNFKLYAGAGMALCFFKYVNVYYGPQDTGQSPNGLILNSYDFNGFDDTFMLKIGARIGKRWDVFASYLGSTYTTNNQDYFSLTSNCKQIGLTYSFN
jgi:hypothetical protein